mmetsp:Transcript_25995/g.78730  ORF Transcript_25995/g.78730 Transcript_25995/m.78730 type:complete len:209 (+) Transcript_25995:812-1438(+)
MACPRRLRAGAQGSPGQSRSSLRRHASLRPAQCATTRRQRWRRPTRCAGAPTPTGVRSLWLCHGRGRSGSAPLSVLSGGTPTALQQQSAAPELGAPCISARCTSPSMTSCSGAPPCCTRAQRCRRAGICRFSTPTTRRRRGPPARSTSSIASTSMCSPPHPTAGLRWLPACQAAAFAGSPWVPSALRHHFRQETVQRRRPGCSAQRAS